MDSQSIGKIVASDDVMVRIYTMLDFEDQVRLASTSWRMKSIFIKYIWTHKYSTLHVYPNKGSVIVTNEVPVNKKSLTAAGLQEFLKFYADQIQDLKLYTEVDIELAQLKNLNKLRYICSKNPLEDLHMIGRDISNLACLEFSLGFTTIAWNVESFLQMKSLKHLSLLCMEPMQYRHFHEIVTKLKLKFFKLDSKIEPDEELVAMEQGESEATLNLQELDIKCSFDPQKWGNNLTSFLKHFENLSALSVTISDVVTQEILTQLAETCKNLQTLIIVRAAFRDIQTFSVAAKLRDLTLRKCHGLTYANLKHLLTGTSITKFSTYFTQYQGEYEEFRLSPLIQKLELYLSNMCKLKLVPAGNEHLKELTLYSFEHGLKETVWSNVVESCINLETLHVGYIKVDVNSFVKLKNLHSLYINHYDLTGGGLAPFITTLLKHPTLINLDLHCRKINPLDVSKLTPLEGCVTNITCLSIHYDVFKLCLDFWLDLFSRNSELKLVCSNFFGHQINFLKELVICERFPRNLKTIDVFGFTIGVQGKKRLKDFKNVYDAITDCNDLRSQPDLTVQKLERRIAYLDDLFRIILCRTPLPMKEK